MSKAVQLMLCGTCLLAACDEQNFVTSPPPQTQVRFINATNTAMDVAVGGTASTSTSNIAFGGSTGCLTLNASSPKLSFRNNGTTTDLTGFTASFSANHKYFVVAIAGATATQFVTIDQNFTPSAGNAGVVGLNAITGGGPYDLHVTVPATTLSSSTVTAANLAFGVPSAIVADVVPYNTATPPVAQPQQVQFTGAGNTTVARNHGNVTINPGVNALAIIGPPASGSATLRSIVNQGC